MTTLTSQERLRYDRQMIIPGIGEAGQKKLKQAKVFIAGLGGLGSVSGYYMAAAGVGHLRIADGDCVEFANLNRQILHHTPDIGIPKTESALKKLRALNPFCVITALHETIRIDNVIGLVGDSDIILDGTDNIATRKVLNSASVSLDIPFIYGGVNGFNGTVSTFIPGKTPCFECLFHQQSDKTQSPGVIGPLPAMVAAIQSLEAIKIILEMDGLLTNRLLLIRGVDMVIKKIDVPKNPECPICGPDMEKRQNG